MLHNGTPVTLLDSLNTGYIGGLLPNEQDEQRISLQVILGAHLSGRDHRFTRTRFCIQGLNAPTIIPDESVPVTGGGSINIELRDSATWLTMEDLPEASIRELDRRYMRPLASLVSLACGQDAGLLGVEVASGKQWLKVHSPSHRTQNIPWPAQSLLHPGDLHLQTLAHWLDRVELLGPLPPVVVRMLDGDNTLEAQVLELATVAEGLHRRLRPDTLRFPVEVGAAVRAAAVDAAASIEPAARDAVKGFLTFVHEPGYAQRLKELAEMAELVAPGITGKTSKWRVHVYEARNDFAHRSRQGWLDEAEIDRYLAVAVSLRWLLRAVLLDQAGLSHEHLRQRFRTYGPYQLFLSQARDWLPDTYG
ncbi:hypothetical protein GGQ55_000117 [Geodermatophilus daqingensis]|uniref:Apea-like HEPN domain-containing protein n=1 Tax=Petropleomorpha daqingensis TaxID=2026353 RepID=A0A853C9I8_9ACTN|nr:hypothetical protein [Petropleomorpha daqingensis]